MERWCLSAHGGSLSLPCGNEFFLLLVPAQTLAPCRGKEGGQLCPGRANTKYTNNAVLKQNTKKCSIIFYWEGQKKKLHLLMLVL